MMESQVDRELLEKIADLIGKPVGAFNIRKDTGCDGRQSTENIQITGKTDGKNCHGAEKVRRLHEAYPDVQIAEFYSDSRSDSPLAELAERAYLVHGQERTPW